MNKIIILFNWTIFLSFALPALSTAANITARIDNRSTVYGEPFELTFQTDSAVKTPPDFSLLERDFDIIDTRKEGETSWHLTLQGKRIGIFSIPMIYFGKDRSQTIRVAVKPTRGVPTTHSNNKIITLDVETDVKETWVQSQILYTVRLQQSIELTNVALSPVKTNDPDAIIKKLDTTKKSVKKIGGTAYLVTEMHYAIFPQHSGELIFEPMLLQARISAAASRELLDQSLEQGRTKVIRSKGLSVNTKPKPAHINTRTWAPASSLQLTEQWNADTQKIKVGDPLTRTITIKATGITSAQLPDINLTKVDDLKQYSKSPTMEDEHSSLGIIGIKKISVTIIATKEGQFILPAIDILWWNTTTGKQETAHLDATVLKTSAAVSAITPDTRPPAPAQTTEKPPAIIVQPDNKLWAWVSLTLAAGWLATLLLLVKKARADKGRTSAAVPAPSTDLRPLEKAVLTEANAQQAILCKDALLQWARTRWPDASYRNLASIARLCPNSLGKEILVLNTSLYTNTRKEWDGLRLATAFQHFRQQKTQRHKPDLPVFEPLFKK